MIPKEKRDFSIHTSGGWKKQFQRMIRWLKVLKKNQTDYSKWKEVDIYLDIVITCFQNIFHFKDWLINDASISSTEINEFIKLHKELGLCRDICNGTKHFEIKHQASVDENFMIIRGQDPAYKKHNGPEYFILVLSKAGIHQPSELAQKCIRLWSSFIIQKNLITKNQLSTLRRLS